MSANLDTRPGGWWGNKVPLDYVASLADPRPGPAEVLAGEHSSEEDPGDWRRERDEFVCLVPDAREIGLRFILVRHLTGEYPGGLADLSAATGVSQATIHRRLREIREEIRIHKLRPRPSETMKKRRA